MILYLDAGLNLGSTCITTFIPTPNDHQVSLRNPPPVIKNRHCGLEDIKNADPELKTVKNMKKNLSKKEIKHLK